MAEARRNPVLEAHAGEEEEAVRMGDRGNYGGGGYGSRGGGGFGGGGGGFNGGGGGQGRHPSDLDCIEFTKKGCCWKAKEGWCKFGHFKNGRRLTLEDAGQGAVKPDTQQGGGSKNVFGDDDDKNNAEQKNENDRVAELKNLVNGVVLDADKQSQNGGIEVKTCVEPELVAAWTAKKDGKVQWTQGALDRANKEKAQRANRLMASGAKRHGKVIGVEESAKLVDRIIKMALDAGYEEADWEVIETIKKKDNKGEENSKDGGLESSVVRMFGALVKEHIAAGMFPGGLPGGAGGATTTVSPKRKASKKLNDRGPSNIFGPGPTMRPMAAAGGGLFGAAAAVAKKAKGEDESETDVEPEATEEEEEEEDKTVDLHPNLVMLDTLEGEMEKQLKLTKGVTKKKMVEPEEGKELETFPRELLGPGPGVAANHASTGDGNQPGYAGREGREGAREAGFHPGGLRERAQVDLHGVHAVEAVHCCGGHLRKSSVHRRDQVRGEVAAEGSDEDDRTP